MVERQIPWTTNLDQLGWAVLQFGLIIGVIVFVVHRCK